MPLCVIALIRVDNRLVHGQILETWLPQLNVRRIVVADDEAAKSPLAKAAMTLAVPEEVSVDVQAIDGLDARSLAADSAPVLLIFREVEGLSRAARAGLSPKEA